MSTSELHHAEFIKSFSNKDKFIPKQDKLSFYVKCSDMRRYKVKYGLRLRDAIRAAPMTHKSPEPHITELSEEEINIDTQQNQATYYPLEDLLYINRKNLSPALKEYMKVQVFSPNLEQKKYNNLPSFFLEKYKIISKVLDEDKLHRQIKENQEIQIKSFNKQPQKNDIVKKKNKRFEWEDEMSEIGEEVEKLVEHDLYEEQRRTLEKIRKQEEAKRMFGEQKRIQTFVDPRHRNLKFTHKTSRKCNHQSLPDLQFALPPPLSDSPQFFLPEITPNAGVSSPVFSSPKSSSSVKDMIKDIKSMQKSLNSQFLYNTKSKSRTTRDLKLQSPYKTDL
ncbi:unnamed protein product [Blepharisma stoltei]|uniref:Uncharacterized protein n=1 Tax=Blepharisma stoltei TaxID=1481888 RepID=A0AAU9IZ77_9CILI|nr:unnamed protein product [Blepharisma stoltei]